MSAEAWAERHAKLDAQQIRAMIITTGYNYAEDRALLVDGSALSPSYRALPGGAAIWRRAVGEQVGLIEIYEEVLDRELPEGCYWEEGMLFYTRSGH